MILEICSNISCYKKIKQRYYFATFSKQLNYCIQIFVNVSNQTAHLTLCKLSFESTLRNNNKTFIKILKFNKYHITYKEVSGFLKPKKEILNDPYPQLVNTKITKYEC